MNACVQIHTTHARTHTRTHTHKHTALLGSIKPHLINVLINLDSVIYLRGEKKEILAVMQFL